MGTVWDRGKDLKNRKKHGISLAKFDDMRIDLVVDLGIRNGEPREMIIGPIDEQLHAAVIHRRGDDTRVISLRRAGRKERRVYEAYEKDTRRG
jgi:uncharacterized DUF497 family protein